jgi:hypothetical protein
MVLKVRLAGLAAVAAALVWAQLGANVPFAERARQFSQSNEARGLAAPFLGVTRSGTVEPNLFSIRSSGVSTEPVRAAAARFLAALTADQRRKATFPVDDVEWRKWMNQDLYIRQGVSFREMSAAQRDAAMGLLRAGLSAKGLKLSQDIMKLNYTLGEINGNDFVRFGDDAYWMTVMGEPSKTEPWGWQIDGHHLIVNYFVLGDQVVMTPTFTGSEPVTAAAGKYKGTQVLQDEQNAGLALLLSLAPEQRAKAVLQAEKDRDYNLAEAFKDNLVLDFAGVNGATMTAAQKQQLVKLIGLYVGNMDDGHAKVKMEEVRRHLDTTHFAWIGGATDKSAYYYRIQSPVVLIEFDHQLPVGVPGPRVPVREHIHTVIRTPNGNDYGHDLLRQHYAQHKH